MNNNYYIFRHGETFASKNKVPYGDKEFTAEILPEGVPAIKRLGEYLKNIETHENYTSELLRCRQTSGIVSEITGKEFEKLELINEYLEPSFEEFKARIVNAVDKFESLKGKTYLLCTHGAVVSALKYLLAKGKYEEANLMDYPGTGKLMIIKNATVDVLDFNSP